MSEEFITTTCPYCSKSFVIEASAVGRHGRCDACQQKFVIEATMAEPVLTRVEPVVAVPSASSKGSNGRSTVMIAGLVGLIVAGIGFQMFNGNKTEKARTVVVTGDEGVRPTAEQAPPSSPVSRPPVASAPEVVNPPTASRPGDPPPLEAKFPVMVDFKAVDIREYRQTYPDVHQGWMPNSAEQAEEAKSWGNHLGPLGVRVRSHVPQLQNRPAFAANVPVSLRSKTGELALTAAEVVAIAPKSPADGHLQVGDLIIGIEGEMLKSGNQYRPGWKFMHKDARELQLMLGEMIDRAQGRGDIRLTVLRMPKGQEQPLPVERRELWCGTGGNQSTGVQDFQVDIPGGGFVTLESGQFDDNIHGDGTMWMDVVLEGDYGVRKLFELPSEVLQAGYGKAVIETAKAADVAGKTYQQTLNLHAQGFAKWVIPEGTKRIKGSFAAISYGKVQPKILYTNAALPLTGIHQQSVVELRFPVGKAGSFSETYPKDCPKTDLTVRRHTDWLVAQQRPDGSWPRLAGYTGDGWDTAWCGLALMSGGDAKYDAAVRKAAYRLAYDGAPSEWTAERAMRLIFLSEYYLRTRDAGIVAGIQAAYQQLIDCCKTDCMAGHKVNGFGYGIAGQHYGTGHLALGLALASRTPISYDRDLVGAVIRHAGEVCVNGTYAYGRGRRMARSAEREFGGGNAMSGPGLLGVQIGGGHDSAVREFVERMEASIGDGDNSHATSSLAFILASLSLASADEAVFLKHMRNFRYKMTLDDCWEGGILKSAFPLDFQGGEGVTSNWIRSAGSILVLNALKHNLAITGKKDLWNPKRLQGVATAEWDGQVHSYYLRNWCLAQELLGSQAPKALKEGIGELHGLPRDMSLVPSTRRIFERLAPELVAAIAGNAALQPLQKAYAVELVTGLDFRIHDKKEGGKQKVELEVALPMHQLNWPDTDKNALFASSPFPLRSKVEIVSDNLASPAVFETDGVKDFDVDQGTRKMSAALALKDASKDAFDGVAKIAFKIGTNTLSYNRPLKFNSEFSHSNNYNLRRLNLRLKVAPRAYFQSQALVIAGIPFDCMYPAERMPELQGPGPGVAVKAHEGDSVLVDLASENFICPWVHSIKFETPTQVRVAKPRTLVAVAGKIDGDVNHLADFSLDTRCRISGANSTAVLEFDFGTEVKLHGLDADFPGSVFMRIWHYDGAAWIPLVWDNYSVGTSHHPVFPETAARLWRVEMRVGGGLDVQTLRFYQNPNTIVARAPFPQSLNKEFLPPIQPVPAP